MKRLAQFIASALMLVGISLAPIATAEQAAGDARDQLTEIGVVRSVDPGSAQVEISGAVYRATAASNVEVGGAPSSIVALAPGMKVEIEYYMAVGDGLRELIFLEQLPDSLEIDEF